VSNFGKRLDRIDGIVEQLNQSWNDRLDFPPTKIPERYLRNQLTVALKLNCEIDKRELGMVPLIGFERSLHFDGELPHADGREQNQFSVLIGNVEIVNDSDRTISRVGGIVRLKALNQVANGGVCNRLYFSFVSENTLFIDRPFLENREFNLPNVFYSIKGVEKCQTK